MGSKPKAPPPPPPTPVMPLPDDEAINKAKRRKTAASTARSGRMSTLLSDAADTGNLGG